MEEECFSADDTGGTAGLVGGWRLVQEIRGTVGHPHTSSGRYRIETPSGGWSRR